jgi:hypothetical protein
MSLSLTTSPVAVPILLIAWRRPHTLHRVIDALRPLAPTHLFVACDGPRPDQPGEAAKVEACRHYLDTAIDWPCRLERLYAPTNQGCSLGPVAAINWFFCHVPEGIILEDDCVPYPDFVRFCSELLARYRQDWRIWCISGNNFQDGQRRGDGSYYFSRYANCWGWATWSSRWAHFDRQLSSWPQLQESGLLPSLFPDPVERRYWSIIWERTHRHLATATWWDYQWQFAMVTHYGLSICPAVNLVENVGFGSGASHTVGEDAAHYGQHREALGAIVHPSHLLPHTLADEYLFYRNYLGGRGQRLKVMLLQLKALLMQCAERVQRLARPRQG